MDWDLDLWHCVSPGLSSLVQDDLPSLFREAFLPGSSPWPKREIDVAQRKAESAFMRLTLLIQMMHVYMCTWIHAGESMCVSSGWHQSVHGNPSAQRWARRLARERFRSFGRLIQVCLWKIAKNYCQLIALCRISHTSLPDLFILPSWYPGSFGFWFVGWQVVGFLGGGAGRCHIVLSLIESRVRCGLIYFTP